MRRILVCIAALALAVMVYSAVPILGSANLEMSDTVSFGPDCCRYDNECPGSQTCGSTTGCSAGAPYQCEGGAVIH